MAAQIVMTNFNDESHSLFLNPGRYPYQDRTVESGLSGFTRLFVGWGAHFLDFDNDGALDLLLMNGHLNDTVEQARRNVSYREPPLLLANNGEARFRNMQAVAGPVFSTNYVARGLAVGDFDNDGRLDQVLHGLVTARSFSITRPVPKMPG